MNSKECLKHICDECQINAGKIQVACPFRSISNEYCDKYETIKQDLDRLEKLESQLKDGTLSDGYHTFNDLYYQRLILFATIVNQNKELAWKSLKHEDGELCFGGDWFIVGIETPKGSYTYHYENKCWDLFQCQELEVAKHWDGHTSKDVDRLLSLHHNAFDQLEKQVITLIEAKNKLAKQVKKQQEEYSLLEKENKELKQVVEKKLKKIKRDSGKMASMRQELRKLKGETMPQNCGDNNYE